MGNNGQKFSELFKMCDFLEEGNKSKNVQSMVALEAASKDIQSSSIGGAKKRKE